MRRGRGTAPVARKTRQAGSDRRETWPPAGSGGGLGSWRPMCGREAGRGPGRGQRRHARRPVGSGLVGGAYLAGWTWPSATRAATPRRTRSYCSLCPTTRADSSGFGSGVTLCSARDFSLLSHNRRSVRDIAIKDVGNHFGNCAPPSPPRSAPPGSPTARDPALHPSHHHPPRPPPSLTSPPPSPPPPYSCSWADLRIRHPLLRFNAHDRTRTTHSD